MTTTVGAPFDVGQTVVLGAGPAQDRRWYRTSVYQVDAQTIWLFGAPLGQPSVDVDAGEEVTCHTWRPMDALYEVQAQVSVARHSSESLLGLKIRGVDRIQQREYVRVPLSVSAWALYIGSDSRPARLDLSQAQSVRLEIQDLSAGGLRGRSESQFIEGDELDIDLPPLRTEREPATPGMLSGNLLTLPSMLKPLNLRAKVVRLIESELSERLSCEIGVAFLEVPREVQERIIRFTLEVQRDYRRRGLR